MRAGQRPFRSKPGLKIVRQKVSLVHMSITPILGNRAGNCKFEASLGYVARRRDTHEKR